MNIFAAEDLAAVIGRAIAPDAVNAAKAYVDTLNQSGGMGGCNVVLDVVEETFGDVPACLRAYRDAIQSKKYDVFFGPTNSACMFALPELTTAAGYPVLSGIAADHQPYLENFGKGGKYAFHPSVSTFMEGRAAARFAAENGWKKVGIVAPNYAYGQDAAKSFREYFLKLVPDGEIVTEQFPEFDEDNFTPFINQIAESEPDGVFSAYFGPFIVPFWKQWKAAGLEQIPTIGGLIVLATFEVAQTSPGDIPANSYGYDRAPWQLLEQTPVGQIQTEAARAANPDSAPIVSSFAYQMLNAISMTKAFVEQTGAADPEAWKALVEQGQFAFDGAYQFAPTPVNPLTHMGDNCAAVGLVGSDDTLPVPVTYDPSTFLMSCMDDVLTQEEAAQLVDRDASEITQEALDAYQANVDAARTAREGKWNGTPATPPS
ncbi:MAG: ABC transporter substrate-binding protein [Thermoleophilia bacterium]